MGRERDQRAITLSLTILDRAAYAHPSHAVSTDEVALALTVLLWFARDRQGLVEFWTRAAAPAPHPWSAGSCRESYHRIAADLRGGGWHAPASPAVDR